MTIRREFHSESARDKLVSSLSRRSTYSNDPFASILIGLLPALLASSSQGRMLRYMNVNACLTLRATRHQHERRLDVLSVSWFVYFVYIRTYLNSYSETFQVHPTTFPRSSPHSARGAAFHTSPPSLLPSISGLKSKLHWKKSQRSVYAYVFACCLKKTTRREFPHLTNRGLQRVHQQFRTPIEIHL